MRTEYRLARREFLRIAAVAPCAFGLWESAALAEDVKPGVTEPTADEVARAIEAMNSTVATNVTPDRLAAAETLQRSVDRLRAAEFDEYFSSDAETAKRWENERGILKFLDLSFDKILEELRATKVEDGTVVFWHVYNMGYLVKTPTQTFAIDVKHRRAKELVPDVEFLLITHNHGDHFVKNFCDALTEAGKPVVSNFIENDWHTPEDEAERTFGDCSVKMRRVDHNSRLIKFVTTFEINCGPRSGDCVVYHVGDSCNVNQLNPTTPVDVFIPHLAVGLDVPKAVNETIKPKVTLLSHILELGHLIDKWRWSYQYGYDAVEKCHNDSVILPVWGEKYLYRRG
ncbi:MAG: hypothetical protein IJU03_08925 [Thermoguttaceae bacterium]|nr:hypothetical protein [Thermoguttaceae bacterium]